MSALMKRFALKDLQAGGLLGNLGHESGGFVYLHALGQPEGEGGYGWGQWSGPAASNSSIGARPVGSIGATTPPTRAISSTSSLANTAPRLRRS